MANGRVGIVAGTTVPQLGTDKDRERLTFGSRRSYGCSLAVSEPPFRVAAGGARSRR